MRSGTRRVGGTAAVVLALSGTPVTASAAHARQAVRVPCNTTSLITAIKAANTVGTGTLLLASHCAYRLTAASGTGRGPDGLPLIAGDVSLIGGYSTHITRSSKAPAFRIAEVTAGAVLRLRNIFVTGGNANAATPTNDTGGGILNSRGTVVLDHVTLSGNTAGRGAGLSNDNGRVAVVAALVQRNHTRGGGDGGGGIYNDGTLTAQDSVIRSNRASTNGGGIYNGQGGRAELVQTTVDGNAAGANGGGLYNAADGRLVLVRTLVEHNTASAGGGIFNAGVVGRVTLSGSVVRANRLNNCAPPHSVPGCVG